MPRVAQAQLALLNMPLGNAVGMKQTVRADIAIDTSLGLIQPAVTVLLRRRRRFGDRAGGGATITGAGGGTITGAGIVISRVVVVSRVTVWPRAGAASSSTAAPVIRYVRMILLIFRDERDLARLWE
jgi:hypothetical protein